ncbi:NADPH-dependent FMN reductase [Streptomyces sp. HUAS TT20]|uniref:NADPH-dependent FMN reductase n=1 Tax=Streptomyces sp. HUAS TT20 TaxID=3447509 RepID=UPI0021D8F114|nr:NAD(P)H-dependent oxidoreductase [Streptomyces sp. HUAS 15-9]UXY25354.1 NAD(P)H-dependent oxidoreductase [Streptomyces sp. HUAS 15-9]
MTTSATRYSSRSPSGRVDALRADSANARLASPLARLISDTGATVDLAAMRDFDMPLYGGDMEATEGLPPGALARRERLEKSDSVVISSPEYNASLPGVLKNALDWVSRVRPQPFKTKHAMLVPPLRPWSAGTAGCGP